MPATRGSSPVATAIVMLDRLDVRVDPSTIGFAVGRPSRRGVIRAWLRMADGREPDAALLPYAVDALMPVSFDLGVPGWAPTIELTGSAARSAGARLVARRAHDGHGRRGPPRRGCLGLGLHRPPRRAVPAARRRAAARQLVCSGAHRQPDRRRRGPARRAARHPRAGGGGARGLHAAAVAPGVAQADPRGGGRVARARGPRERRARGRERSRGRPARHRARGRDVVAGPGPRRADDARRARGDGRDRARHRHRAHGAPAGARAAEHGSRCRAWSTRVRSADPGCRARTVSSSRTWGRRRLPKR